MTEPILSVEEIVGLVDQFDRQLAVYYTTFRATYDPTHKARLRDAIRQLVEQRDALSEQLVRQMTANNDAVNERDTLLADRDAARSTIDAQADVIGKLRAENTTLLAANARLRSAVNDCWAHINYGKQSYPVTECVFCHESRPSHLSSPLKHAPDCIVNESGG